MEVLNLADERFHAFSYKMRLKLLQAEVTLKKMPQNYHAFLKKMGLMTKNGSLNLELFKRENLENSGSKLKALCAILKNNSNLSFVFLHQAETCNSNN